MAKIPKIKKDLKFFLTSEEAKITKKNALKMGLSIMAAFFALQAIESYAQHTNVSYLDQHASAAAPATGRHVSHSSHTSHGSHGQW